MEIANSIEPVQDGSIHIELINWPFLQEHRGTPAAYKAGLDFAIERGWLWLRHSGRLRTVRVNSGSGNNFGHLTFH